MKFLASISVALIEWAVEKASILLSAWLQRSQAKALIEQKAKEDRERLKEAKTEDEKKDAVAHIANDTFGK